MSHCTVPSQDGSGTAAPDAHGQTEQEEHQADGGPPKYGYCKRKQVDGSLAAERAVRGSRAVGPTGTVVGRVGCKYPHAADNEPDEDEKTQQG